MKLKNIFLPIFFAVCVTALLASLYSCRKRSPNGELDGFWQIETVEYFSTGEVASPYPKHYICLNLHVVNLQVGNESLLITGNMHYDKSSGVIAFDFPASQYNQSLGDPESFGFMKPQVDFKVVKLDHKQLVIQSEETLVKCRRF